MSTHYVIANDWAGTGKTGAERLRNLCAFDSRDWSLEPEDALLFGIVLGWDDDEDEDGKSAMEEVATRHGWSDDEIFAINAMHSQFEKIL